MTKKVGMISLGCPKNQVDAEIMLSKLQNGGFEIVSDPAEADVVIVNTCYVKLPTENKIIYKIQPFYCMLHQK